MAVNRGSGLLAGANLRLANFSLGIRLYAWYAVERGQIHAR